MPARILALLAPLVAGCVSMASYGSARTLPEGKFEVWTAPQLLLPSQWPDVMPSVELGVRVGMTDAVEVALRALPWQFVIETKVQLARDETPDRGIDLAIAPSVAYPSWPDMRWGLRPGTYSIRLPLLFGLNVGGGNQIVVSPSITWWLVREIGLGAVIVGLSVGPYLRVLGRFRIMPEVAMGWGIGQREFSLALVGVGFIYGN